MKKKGFTIIEIIISVGLISIVMLLLFQLLNDMEYAESHSSFAKENQVNRATIIKNVQNDMMNYTLKNVFETTQGNNKEINFDFENFTRILVVSKNTISYNGEEWLLESSSGDASFDLAHIGITMSSNTCSYTLNVDANGDGTCDYNCDTNRNGILDANEFGTKNELYKTCPSYKSIRVLVPVINIDQKDNSIDDLEFFYIGK